MIYYYTDKIYDWNFEDDNIVKVYRNGAICYYKIVVGSSAQTPCYAVVEDITQYQETEFVDVYDKATSKWYKLNNLNDYEEYGVYGRATANTTYYEGKLALDDNKEYIYSGNGWTLLGDVSGTSMVIQSPEYIEKNASYKGLIDLQEYMTPTTRLQIKMYPTSNGGGFFLGDYMATDTDDWRIFFYSNQLYYDFIEDRTYVSKSGGYLNNLYEWEIGQFYVKDITASTNNIINKTYSGTYVRPKTMKLFGAYYQNTDNYSSADYGRVYYIKIYDGNTLVRDFIPIVSGGTYGLFDKVSLSAFTTVGTLTASTTINEVEVGDAELPMYYTVKQEPPASVTFASMAEAEAYQCPYVGLLAYINGDLYVFAESGSSYVWQELAYNISGTTKSSSNFNIRINDEEVTANVYSSNGDNTYNWGVVYTDPISSVTSMASGNTNLLTFDWGDSDTSQLTSIGSNAFSGCTAMTSMPSIPSAVTSIGNYAFYNCYSMNSNGSLTIPSGITSIGNNAFEYVFNNSSSPRSLYLPSSLTSIGSYAFRYNQYLTNIYITDLSSYMNITMDNTSPFNGSQAVTQRLYVNGVQTTSIVIPSDITSTKNYSFANAKMITSVTIPSTTTKLSNYVFSLSGVKNVDTSNATSLNEIGQSAFQNCRSLSSITIPNTVTHIRQNAFYDTSLTSITIPTSVISMGGSAFSNCTALTSVSVEGTTPPELVGNNVFSNSTCPIYVPCASVNTFRTANRWSTYADRILGFENCTTYQWITVQGEYTCYEGDKYSVEKQQRSFDGGTTWEDSGEYRRGSVIEYGSADCSGLPNVPFSLNYNAKEYDTTNNLFPKTSGQLVDVDGVISGSPAITAHTADGYISYSGGAINQGIFIEGYQQYINRDNTSGGCEMTIISKQLGKGTTNSGNHLFANRYQNWQWMYRVANNVAKLHGATDSGQIAVSNSEPNIVSVRTYFENGQVRCKHNNWTQNTSNTNNYAFGGGTAPTRCGMFNGYAGYSSGEYFNGDFYWIYIAPTALTDDQIQQVIWYNENL